MEINMTRKKIGKMKGFRRFLLKQIEDLDPVQLNHIPSGFNNNIIWNLGNMLSAEQTMCYVRAGLPPTIDNNFLSPYLPGTKPERPIDQSEIERIKALLITSLDKLESDLANQIFVNYTPSLMIPKVYGFEVNNIDEAIDYLLYHDGYHSGCILSLKHLV